MKVYILIWGHYDTCRHRAVYATREAAEAQAAKDQATMDEADADYHEADYCTGEKGEAFWAKWRDRDEHMYRRADVEEFEVIHAR